MVVPQGQRGFPGSAQTGRSVPKRSFVRPSWMDEDTVESAAMSESVFFSKVSSRTSRRGFPASSWCLCPAFVFVSFLSRVFQTHHNTHT